MSLYQTDDDAIVSMASEQDSGGLESMEDDDEHVADDADAAKPPPFLPFWFKVAGCVLMLVVPAFLLLTVGPTLSNEDVLAQALWVDYTHAVGTVGGGSAGNGGRNVGRAPCPGSPESPHAKCQMTVAFEAPCMHVLAMINGRVAGLGGWRDCKQPQPGVYQGTAWQASRTTGNGVFTDLLRFRFEPTPEGEGASAASGGCRVSACSESQVRSGIDYSTNFCTLHNLYALEDDGVDDYAADDYDAGADLNFNFSYHETFTDCRQHDLTECCRYHDCDAHGKCEKAP